MATTPIYNFETGNWEAVSEEKVRPLVQSGRYGFSPEQQLTFTDPDRGDSFTASGTEAADLMSAGFNLQNASGLAAERRAEEFDNPLAAGALGAARGLTFGLSDQLATGLGANPYDLKFLKEENPTASLVGEIGGAVAPVLLGGGAGLLGQGARAVGAAPRAVAALGSGVESAIARGAAAGFSGAGRRVLAKGVGSAIEGSLYGVGQLVSEDALGDAELNADKIISTVGMGALIGGAAGGVFGAGEELIGAGVRAARQATASRLGIEGAETISDALRSMSDDQAFRSLNATRGQIKKTATGAGMGDDVRAFSSKIGKLLKKSRDELDGRPLMGDTVEETLDNTRIAIEAADQKRVSALQALDASGASSGLTGEKIAERIRRELIETGPLADAGPLAREVTGQVEDLASRLEEFGGETLSLIQAEQAKQFLQNQLRYEKLNKTYVDVFKERATSILRDEIEEAALRADNALGRQFVEAKREMTDLFRIQDLSMQGVERFTGNRTPSLTDQIAGAAGFAGGLASGNIFSGAAYGFAAGAVNRVAAQRGNALASRAFDRIARALDGADGRIDAAIRAVASAGKAASKTTGVASKFAYRGGKEVAKSAATDAAKQTSPRRIIGPAASKLLEAITDDSNDDEQGRGTKTLRDQIGGLSKINPQRAAQRMVDSIGRSGERLPQTTIALTARAVKAAEFLKSKAPSTNQIGRGMMPRRPSVSPAEVARFGQYLEAIEDPLRAVERVADGTLTRQHVEALQAVYPAMYEETVRRLQDHVLEKSDSVPYPRRLALSILFDAPFDGTFSPEFIGAVQGGYAIDDPAATSGVNRPTAGGLAKLNIAEKAKTPSEALLSA